MSEEGASSPILDPDQLAQAVGEKMYSKDLACQMMGIKVEAIGPGYARLSMKVRRDMLNGHAICHGGFIFTLADSCFAYACNSRNQNAVAAACSIDFLLPAAEQEELVAEATEQSLAGRMGVYDIVVTGSQGRRVALFRGKSYRIAGQMIASEAPL